MKRYLFILIVAVMGLAGCASSAQAPAEAVPTQVLLSFQPDVQFTPFYVAVERGFFEEAGFDVTIGHRSESDIARAVATSTPGSDELAIGVISGEQHLLARAQGLPIVYIYEWYQQYPVAVAAKEGSGITDVADLAGLSVGVPMLEGASYIGLQALLASGGLSEADIDLQATGFTQVETLVTDRVDAVVVYTANEPTQLAARGEAVTVLPVADYADLVSNGLIANEARIAEQPDLLERFAAAFDEALAFTLANPDEAFEIAKGFVEGLDDPDVEGTARAVFEASLPLWQAERLGLSEASSWGATQDVLLASGLLEEPLDLESAYTNDFVP